MTAKAQAQARTGLRIGVDGVRARAVAVDRDGEVVAVHRGRPRRDPPGRLVEALFGHGIEGDGVDRVVAILPDIAIAESARRARIGVLRIGAPAATAVPPLTGWPADLAAVAGPVATVRGGHEYDGRISAPLDVAAVTGFARACAGNVEAVALAGVNALENPEHERLAAAALTDQIGPDVPVIRGAETESLGLLERENTAVLDAALATVAGARVDELGAAVRAHAPDAASYVVRGDGTVLPALDAPRHATGWLGAALGALLHGAARLAGVPSAVVVEVTADGVTVGTTLDGLLPDSGLPRRIEGIKTGLRAPRVTVLPGRGGAFTDRVFAAIGRAQRWPDETPVVVVGDRADELPDPPGVAVFRPPQPDLAGAYGAAVAEAAGSVDRIFWQGAGAGQDSVARARRLAMDAALRTGADPGRLRETPVRQGLLTYVPVPAARLQVTAVGPLLEAAETAVAP